MRLSYSLADSAAGRSKKALMQSLRDTGADEAAAGPLLLAAPLPAAISLKRRKKSAPRAGATGEAQGQLLEAEPLGTMSASRRLTSNSC